LLADLAPQEAEAQGLLALMEIQASRTAARTDEQGRPVLLAAQDRGRWDRLRIQRGLAALARAEGLAQPGGPYQLQAAIAACHARPARAEDTDWARISALYAMLMQVAPSPVVELNRAVAVSMHEGPAAGLAIVDALCNDKALRQYQWLPSVRGDLLERLGRRDEARAEFEQAAALAGNQREKALLLERAARLS
jgi:predicted RNA polymerase sigma factor